MVSKIIYCLVCLLIYCTCANSQVKDTIPANKTKLSSASDSISAKLDATKFTPSNIVFLLDISASMAKENKMPLLRKSMERLLIRLRKIDRVHLVTFGNAVQVLYSTTSLMGADSLNRILKSVRSIASATNINGGLHAAYEIVLTHLLTKSNNEILIITDGEFVFNKHTVALVQTHPQIKLTAVLVGEKTQVASAAAYIQSALNLPVVSLITDDVDLDKLATHIEKNAAKE